MLNMCVVSLVMVFFAIGVYFTVKEMISLIIHNNIPVRVVVEIDDNADSAESTVRSVLSANPYGDIVIINQGTNDEVYKILDKISKDNRRVHIVNEKAPE